MRMHRVAAVLAAVVLVPLTGAWADHRDGVGLYGRMAVDGVVVSVRPLTSTFALRVVRPSHIRERGDPILTVWVQRGTRVDEGGHPLAVLDALRPGDRVRVDGFRLDDGRLLALEMEVRERAGVTPGSGVVVVRGVVVARGPALIVIVDSQGTTRVILVVATTRLVGPRQAFHLLQPRDEVVVLGLANADGTIAARQIQVVAVSPGP
ncbi:MAG: DUF5666 domain-containing protein [Armatimonadota bacterium]|nr:DUF5666 domain-containing protein [Armatimonadota bacterium]MDR7436577.1 DUF5666 domain-containing protein [Armatimonadota bacterium]MDR7473111.1 DUF5666 domain-containing protein [Armatimonadota bacterium]MDR7506588.1 DUF5666 domain-containing protein [Armatimonadota bacterium]MDR7509176.1 DUF5666 domain-containing protein [Armatimonadota bacterium]